MLNVKQHATHRPEWIGDADLEYTGERWSQEKVDDALRAHEALLRHLDEEPRELARFKGLDLSGLDFRNRYMRDVSFEGCNLAGAHFNGKPDGVYFGYCNLVGATGLTAKRLVRTQTRAVTVSPQLFQAYVKASNELHARRPFGSDYINRLIRPNRRHTLAAPSLRAE